MSHPKKPAKNPTGDFGRFTEFMKRLVAVPHSEIKSLLDVEREDRKRIREKAVRASGEKH